MNSYVEKPELEGTMQALLDIIVSLEKTIELVNHRLDLLELKAAMDRVEDVGRFAHRMNQLSEKIADVETLLRAYTVADDDNEDNEDSE